MTTTKKTKAILIDAKNNTVKFVEVGNYTDIYKHTGFEMFTTVRLDAKGNTLYVDDEGLLNGTNFGFTFDGYETPLMGNALLIGTNIHNGEDADTDFTLEDVVEKTKAFDLGYFGNRRMMFLKEAKLKIVA